MRRAHLNIDSKLDDDINMIIETFKQQGFRNVKKPDVLRLLIEDYKRRGFQQRVMRKPKRNEWMLV